MDTTNKYICSYNATVNSFVVNGSDIYAGGYCENGTIQIPDTGKMENGHL